MQNQQPAGDLRDLGTGNGGKGERAAGRIVQPVIAGDAAGGNGRVRDQDPPGQIAVEFGQDIAKRPVDEDQPAIQPAQPLSGIGAGGIGAGVRGRAPGTRRARDIISPPLRVFLVRLETRQTYVILHRTAPGCTYSTL